MDFEILNGDCLEIMKTFNENYIDCVITSPPYNINIKYGTYKDDKTFSIYLQFMNDVAQELFRILKPSGHLFLNIGYSNKEPWIASDVANEFRKYFILQNNITWVKSITVNEETFGNFKPINSERYLSPTNEMIYHFVKNDKTIVNKFNIGVPFADKSNLNKDGRVKGRLAKKFGFDNINDFNKNATDEQKEEFEKKFEIALNRRKDEIRDVKDLGNTWFIPYEPIISREKDRGNHPATYPVKLVTNCLKLIDISDDMVILDPFLGTGTTLMGLKTFQNIKCKGVGIDIDEDYIEYSKERLNDIIFEI